MLFRMIAFLERKQPKNNHKKRSRKKIVAAEGFSNIVEVYTSAKVEVMFSVKGTNF